jgi:hypothetical protein
MEGVGRYIVIALVTAVTLAISALLSISGRIRPPLGISIVDTTVSATTLILLIIVVTAWQNLTPEFPMELSVRDVLALCVLGFVLGAGVRAARWVALAVAIEPNGTAVGLRPLAAFAVTTVVFIVAGQLGLHMRPAAEGWMVLAPATMVAAWLDVWLENSKPHPLSPGRPTESRWAIPVVAGSAILFAGVLVYENLRHALAEDASLQQVKEKVRLPNGPSTVTAGFGHRIPVDADVEGGYQIIAEANPDERITLFLIQDTDQHILQILDKQSGDKPTIKYKLEKNKKYFVCVMPEVQRNCSLSIVAALRDFDMLVINGNIWREIDPDAAHKISLSPARSP